ncbi:hypothetical protein D7D52_34215 [Nocardia yunnanensis]|uniref:ESX-1 secretion-associated protein n=1 Tax=Nocardia yunnanensis TaxID=2382165 RepID=A0A386ZJJ4_9NOCA|nr:hypothetical protein [Nocardia yunnanensis]AYF78042.1 hypothetical protein D7D52_34215 [Nocardia yunnanensis]
MDGDTERVAWDHPSAVAYVNAAQQAAALLDSAQGQAQVLAGIDLSGLGVLGRGFAAAWSQAWAQHVEHLGTASDLTDRYGQSIIRWGNVLGATDAESAARIAGAGDGDGQV